MMGNTPSYETSIHVYHDIYISYNNVVTRLQSKIKEGFVTFSTTIKKIAVEA